MLTFRGGLLEVQEWKRCTDEDVEKRKHRILRFKAIKSDSEGGSDPEHPVKSGREDRRHYILPGKGT